MSRLPRLFAEGHRMYRRNNKTAHWVPKGNRSVCGKLDRGKHKTKKVATLAGFIPHDLCGLCKKEMEREWINRSC